MTTCHNVGSEINMPSKTFLNLPEHKQKKLIKAAMDEFLTVSFTDVSINRIINKAEISRGSFYTYFKDKGDLFEYLLDSFNQKMASVIKNALNNNDGDIRYTFIALYDDINILIKRLQYKIFFKNVFIYANLGCKNKKEPMHSLFESVKMDISQEKIKGDDLEFVFVIFMNCLLSSLVDSIINNETKVDKEQYLRKIDIICYGIYK